MTVVKIVYKQSENYFHNRHCQRYLLLLTVFTVMSLSDLLRCVVQGSSAPINIPIMSRLSSIRDDDAEDGARKPFVPPHLLGEQVCPVVTYGGFQATCRGCACPCIGDLQAASGLLW